jgi:hypothetical protein
MNRSDIAIQLRRVGTDRPGEHWYATTIGWEYVGCIFIDRNERAVAWRVRVQLQNMKFVNVGEVVERGPFATKEEAYLAGVQMAERLQVAVTSRYLAMM